jgi:hypothetical protein
MTTFPPEAGLVSMRFTNPWMYARSKPEGDSAGSAAEKAGWSVWNQGPRVRQRSSRFQGR